MATIPSISLIPSGYKAGKVYSVLPTDGSGDLDFARTTTATRINKNGLIENVGNNVPRLDYEDGSCPSLLLEPTSRNLITQSESFGNSYWTKSGASIEGDASTAGSEEITNGDFATDSDWTKFDGATISGGKANINTTGAGNQLKQSSILIVGKFYLIQYTISNYVSGSVTLSGVSNAVNLSENGTFSFYGNGTSTNFAIYSNSANSVLSIDNVSVKEVSGFSAPSVDSPLGAFKLVDTSSNTFHRNRVSVSLSINTDYSLSVFVKKGTLSNVQLALRNTADSNTASVVFDVDNGLIGEEINSLGGTITSKSIEYYTDGWYRCVIVAQLDTAPNTSQLTLAPLTTGNATTVSQVTYLGDGTGNVSIFGAQIEQQSYATSYIPTSGSQITRLSETANGAGNASTFNDSEGVLMANISALNNDLTNRGITISDGSTNNRITMFYTNVSNAMQVKVVVGGSSSLNSFITIPNISTYNKFALKYKTNAFSLFVNGFELINDTIGNTFSDGTLTRLAFDRGDGAEDFFGNIKQLQYYKTALTDLELETLTSYSSFNEMALAQNYIIQ